MVGARGVLGWNGQVGLPSSWRILNVMSDAFWDQIFDGMDVGVNENDTKAIFERLEAGEQVEHVLRGIEGPYVLTARSLNSRLADML